MNARINIRTFARLGVIAVVLAACAISGAQTVDEAKVAQVKAAYLLNFIRFTQWPERAFADSQSPILIAVLGDDPLGRTLDGTVRGAKVGERSIVIQRHKWPIPRDYRTTEAYESARDRTIKQLRESHLLYLTPSTFDNITEIMAHLVEAPVLMVGDGVGFMQHKSLLALSLEDERIIFYANADLIEKSDLKVSSRLLKLARLYKLEAEK